MKRVNPKILKGALRVRRGGNTYDLEISCRSAYRFRTEPSHAFGSLGLRLAIKKHEKNKS